jgi:hypothetical protein
LMVLPASGEREKENETQYRAGSDSSREGNLRMRHEEGSIVPSHQHKQKTSLT